jgi:hypothetical protein
MLAHWRPPTTIEYNETGHGKRENDMSQDIAELQGTLRPDGTLVLDEKPNLPPGRVDVVLRRTPEPSPPPVEDWWQFMQRARRELEAAGQHFMNEEEIQAHVEWLREGDRIDDLLRQTEKEGEPRE